jgi:hypothetical protein
MNVTDDSLDRGEGVVSWHGIPKSDESFLDELAVVGGGSPAANGVEGATKTNMQRQPNRLHGLSQETADRAHHHHSNSTEQEPPPVRKRQRRHYKNRSPGPRQPEPEQILAQLTHRQVRMAADCVQQALYAGPWPSPVDVNDENGNGCGDIPKEAQEEKCGKYSTGVSAHFSMVGASLQQYSLDVILPAILQAQLDSVVPSVSSTAGLSRPFLGTMLLLREVLIQNSESIFGDKAIMEVHGNETDETVVDALVFGSRVLVTAVMLCALQQHLDYMFRDSMLPDAYSVEVDKFLALMQDYDSGGLLFSKVIQSVDNMNAVLAVLPRTADPVDHAAAWKSSFFRHLKRHPLYRHAITSDIGDIDIPETNAVHITILQTGVPE